MRTGPFSDPAVVTLVNRYFVALHLDNRDGSARRYGMEPGHENAYIILETPDIPGGPKVDTRILNRLGQVLDPISARAEMVAFLKKHARFHQPWPELASLERATDEDSRLKRAELLLEEGDAQRALELAADLDLPRAPLVRARASRLLGRWPEAEAALESLASEPEVELERIRLAVDRRQDQQAADMLGRFLARDGDAAGTPGRWDAGEPYFLRGWLHHLAGQDDLAAEVWQNGISRHPPSTSLFSQKARLTMIRANWELPANVDQPK